MSRQELAEAINAYLWRTYEQDEKLDENDIGKLERGEHRWPGARRREAFRAVLAVARDADLGFYINRKLRGTDSAALVEAAGPASDMAVIVTIVVDGRIHCLRLSRRTLFEAVSGSLMAPLFEGVQTQVPAAIDPAVVDHFSALRALLVDSDNRLGAASILPTVHQQLGLIGQFRRQARGTLHDQLLRTEARWVEFAGWLSDDLGDQSAGTRWLGQAMSMAHEAADPDFSAYLFARMAQRAVGGMDEDRVLGLAQAASRIETSSPHVQAFAALQRAHGHSLAGEIFLFRSAIDEARQLIDGPAPRDGDLGSFCTAPYVTAQEGEGWLRLNRPQDAADSFGRALAMWPEAYQRDRGVYLSRAATAHLASGRPDEAAATALEALKLADVTQSTRIRRQVVIISQRISEIGPGSAVDSLRAALSVEQSLS